MNLVSQSKSIASDFEASINKLPHDVMLNIFGFFSRREIGSSLARVCKRWWTLSRDSYLLKEMAISRRKQSPRYMAKVPLLNLISYAAQLTSFSIDNERVVSGVFVALAKNCPLLRILEATNCQNLSDKAIEKVARSCSRLTTLTLEGTTGVLKCGYRHLAKLGSLTHLNIELCGDRMDAPVTCLDQNGFREIVENCPLQSLLLFDADRFRISASDFEFLVEQKSVSLRELSMNTSKISSRTLSSLSRFQNLEVLYIGGVTVICEEVLVAIAELRQLQSLSLVMHIDQEIPCAAILTLFTTNAMQHLTKLELQSFIYVDDSVLLLLALNCTRLVYVSLINTAITDNGFEVFTLHCRSIQELDLSYNFDMLCYSLLNLGERLSMLKKLVIEPNVERRKELNLMMFSSQHPDVEIVFEVVEF